MTDATMSMIEEVDAPADTGNDAVLLLNEEIYDPELLVNRVLNNCFCSLDSDIPVVRFRGTMIKRVGEKRVVVGWQRNVSRLQKMDVSLPTVINLEINKDNVITEVSLDDSFQGSKGLLCNHAYLHENLRKAVLNKTIGESFFKEVQVSNFHCFHLVEVFGGITACLELMDELGIDQIFEEEVTDCMVVGEDFHIVGKHMFSFAEKPLHYRSIFKEAVKKFKFNKIGGIYAEKPVDYKFLLNDEVKMEYTLVGNTDKRLCLGLKVACIESVNHVRDFFLTGFEGNFLCTSIYFQAFIGLLFQSVSMKVYHNNLNYVLHTLNSIQRNNNIPQCIGAVDDQEEATHYFPGFDLQKIF